VRRKNRTAVALVATLAFVAAACGGDDASDAVPEERTATVVVPAADAVPGSDQPAEELVRFTTPDGEELEGTVHGEGPIGIVLAHMRGRDRSTWTSFARAAATEGHQVLRFDFRGYGGSSGEADTQLDVDLIAAVSFLANRGVSDVVVMGASMGATATVNVAAQIDLAAAVSLSAPADFQGLAALAVAAQVNEPLLVIAAENDQPYAGAAVEFDAAAPASQLQIFSGNAHGTNLFNEHEAALTNLLLDFVANRVG
jgi:pimeloyl-ACP methyl ester carboxylesterase